MSSTYRISGGDFDGAGAATRSLKGELARLGVDAGVMRRIMIAAYEAEMNVVIHARRGSMWARLDGGRLDLEIVDEGPGIPDLEAAMREGFSTAPEQARHMGFGAGMGLPNIRKSSDLFDIDSRVGRGTRVRSTIYLRGMAAAATGAADPAAGGLGIRGERCRSCMDCLKACPTGALRVRSGGPVLLGHLCIDCTACISSCPSGVFGIKESGAERAPVCAGEGAVLVLPRGFVSGFPGSVDPSRVLGALGGLGFSRIRFTEEWESPIAGETARRAAADPGGWPLISPSCPAVTALVETHFPSLISHLAPLASPIEAALAEYSLEPVSLAAACPAQHAAALQERLTDRLTVIPLPVLTEAVRQGLALQPAHGAMPGALRAGKAEGSGGREVQRVTGIRHVMAVLEQAEGGALADVPVLECFACDQGCLGSPLFAADPFVAARLWQGVAVPAPGAAAPAAGETAGLRAGETAARPRRAPFAARAGLRLDPDMGAAMEKLTRIDALTRTLPGRDCAACGAPCCAALAEDVVLGRAAEGDCPHLTAGARRDQR